ncbi:hypothetical protein WK90_19215 [Burkholderia cepacia]|nr:hypothetical protein WK83_10750 [Burkholderia cepacia]KVV68971.1 hypothetical protein WK85_21740 [Burkholderia cepacia]KVV69342.1 hypothetical protein WK84_18755 [Burkholderia cepacia]KVV89379.1 hypothetical protein WK86_04490 [Burkholderia cepacia]KVV93747.1 hypothetical protein WK87_10455 [Burkholderia cepacia]
MFGITGVAWQFIDTTEQNDLTEHLSRTQKLLGITRYEHAYGDTEAATLGLRKRNTMSVVPEPPKMSSSMTDSYVAK